MVLLTAAIVVEILALLGWPEGLRLAGAAKVPCEAAAEVLKGMLLRVWFEVWGRISARWPAGTVASCFRRGRSAVLELDCEPRGVPSASSLLGNPPAQFAPLAAGSCVRHPSVLE